MAMTINTNIASIAAQRHLNESRQDLDLAMERLSSGQRINSAKDDAAGLAIRDKMSSQIVGLNQSIRNANDAISLAQTAEGAMEESVSILHRMRVLAMQAVNDTNTDSDRANLNDEFTQLQLELTRIGITSSFNNVKLLDGTFTGSTFQVGPGASETIFLKISDQKANAIGTTYDVASFDIFSADTTAAGDNLSLTIRGAGGNGVDLSVKYTTTEAESAKQTASGMVLALNSDSDFTQKYQALSDADNTVLIRRTDGTSMGLPIRAEFDLTEATGTTDTVTVTVDGVATGGATKTFTYPSTTDQSAAQVATGVAGKLNGDTTGFGRFYQAFSNEGKVEIRAKDGTNVDTSKITVKQYTENAVDTNASTAVTLKVTTEIAAGATASITIDDKTFTTDPLAATAGLTAAGKASAIAAQFAALEYPSTTVTLTAANGIGDGETVAIALDTNHTITATGSSTSTAADLAALFAAQSATGWDITNNGEGVVTFTKNANYVTASSVEAKTAIASPTTVTVAGTAPSGGASTVTITATNRAAGANISGWDISAVADVVTFTKSSNYVGGTTGGTTTDNKQSLINTADRPKVEIEGAGAVSTTAVDTAGISLLATRTDSKIINERMGFEVSISAGSSTQGALSVSTVARAEDVTVDKTGVLSASDAMEAVRVVDDAIAMIGRERAGLGAFQNRLEHAMSNMANNSQNTQAARSVIADADYAKEAANLAKNQILQQAGTAMLAQANSQSETVLNLLK